MSEACAFLPQGQWPINLPRSGMTMTCPSSLRASSALSVFFFAISLAGIQGIMLKNFRPFFFFFFLGSLFVYSHIRSGVVRLILMRPSGLGWSMARLSQCYPTTQDTGALEVGSP